MSKKNYTKEEGNARKEDFIKRVLPIIMRKYFVKSYDYNSMWQVLLNDEKKIEYYPKGRKLKKIYHSTFISEWMNREITNDDLLKFLKL